MTSTARSPTDLDPAASRAVPRVWPAVAEVLFSTDPALRPRLRQSALALMLATFFCAMGVWAAWQSGAPMPVAWTWAACTLAALLAAYLAIRLGFTRSMADPSLGAFQVIHSMTSAAACYALMGPFRAVVFPGLIVVLLFGLYVLSPRMVAGIAVYTVALFGVVMAFMVERHPGVHQPDVELLYFVMLAVMLPVVPLVTAHYTVVRDRHLRQRHDLERVQALASVDELTGLVNRRHMTELLVRAQARGRTDGRTVCIAVVDLDHFKRINDAHGHATGDEVLRQFARVARATVRDSDTVARWGGEEFVVLLNGTQMPEALAAIERLRVNLDAASVRVGQCSVKVTLSAGLVEPGDGESFERALSRADDALYAAKAQGRNRVVMA